MTPPDPLPARAERWLASGLFDVEFYSALRHRPFASPVEAAEDFVGHGMPHRLSPHPLLDVVSLPPEVRRAYRQGKVNPVLRQLTDDAGRVRPVGPLTEAEDLAAVREHMIAVASRLAVPPTAPAARPQPPVAGRTSLVVNADGRAVLRAAASAVRDAGDAGDADLEVLVAVAGLEPAVALALHAWAWQRLGGLPQSADGGWVWSGGSLRFATVPLPARDLVNLATGDVVMAIEDSCEVRRGWLPEVRRWLADPEVDAVQPVLVDGNDLILAAGQAADGTPLLATHPPEDAWSLRGVSLPALSEAAQAFRGGAGPPAPGGEFRLAVEALVTVRGAEPAPTTAATAPRPPVAPEGLRWSLKLPSPPGNFGDSWGDTHYAGSLARALRALGHDVVTRRRGAHEAGPVHLDDVSLALRGLHPIPPTPGQRNVLWVISHPEEVDPAEFEGYDVVCAASAAWSEAMSVRAGRPVIPLLQASEFGRAPSDPTPTGADATVVFVGTNLGTRERPLVWQAVEAGLPLTVYGPGWEGLPAGVWQGAHVPNEHVPQLYRSHGIVLADHWPDMARDGFVANRVFDAIAAGARVISDEVVGIHDVFSAADVAVVRRVDDLAPALAQLRSATGPPADVPGGLSFGDRARCLVDLVSGV